MIFDHVLARIADLPVSRLHELLPWEWKCLRQTGETADQQAAWPSRTTIIAPTPYARGLLSRGQRRMRTLDMGRWLLNLGALLMRYPGKAGSAGRSR